MPSEMAIDLEIDQDRMMVLSLKPRFAKAILSGAKTVELRRVEPKIVVPTRALVYATTPTRALLGTCVVTAVITESLSALWNTYGSQTGLDHSEFLGYFNGTSTGTALTLCHAKQFDKPISLATLRSAPKGFRPPQSFAYLDTNASTQLLSMAA